MWMTPHIFIHKHLCSSKIWQSCAFLGEHLAIYLWKYQEFATDYSLFEIVVEMWLLLAKLKKTLGDPTGQNLKSCGRYT
jgi:hypothetical protein